MEKFITKYADEIVEHVNGRVYRYSAEWIKTLEPEMHWRLYWQQIAMMQDLVREGDRVLEIGVGSGFTANYLRSKGVQVTTMDIDERKDPDIVANIVEFDWSKYKFDHVLAFEVFEHIPFTEFTKILQNLSTVCKSNLFFSVPRSSRDLLTLDFRLALLGSHSWRISLPGFRLTTPYHYWEIGIFHTRLNQLKSVLHDHAFHMKQQKHKLGRYFFAVQNRSNG